MIRGAGKSVQQPFSRLIIANPSSGEKFMVNCEPQRSALLCNASVFLMLRHWMSLRLPSRVLRNFGVRESSDQKHTNILFRQINAINSSDRF